MFKVTFTDSFSAPKYFVSESDAQRCFQNNKNLGIAVCLYSPDGFLLEGYNP